MERKTISLLSILVACAGPGFATEQAPVIPEPWDPALAGDLVMEQLVTVTDPEVKGAHDAEMAIVGDRAYLVAEVDDEAPGESAARAPIAAPTTPGSPAA